MTTQPRILILQGPNLNLLGLRQPEVYGRVTMAQLHTQLRRQFPTVDFIFMQSNSEGALVSAIQAAGYGHRLLELATDGTFTDDYSAHPGLHAIMAAPVSGVVLNAGGYTHTSVALRDAVASIPTPVVEVHISDIHAREPFRHHSYLTDVCAHSIIGHGIAGYAEAVKWIIDKCCNN